jgi:transposase
MFLRKPKTEIWFEDECHFQQHGSRCNMWIPPEEHDPVLLLSPTRKSISVFGAVCSTDGRFASMMAPVFNAATFLLFLKRLVKRGKSRNKIILVLDNARWHHARDLKPWLHKYRKRICLFFLPPYSPHLNPIERVWKLTRYNATHNRYFKELTEVKQVIQSQFKRWHKPNETLSKLCAVN